MSFKNFNYTGRYKIFSDNGNIITVGTFTSKQCLDLIIEERKKISSVTGTRFYFEIFVDERATDEVHK